MRGRSFLSPVRQRHFQETVEIVLVVEGPAIGPGPRDLFTITISHGGPEEMAPNDTAGFAHPNGITDPRKRTFKFAAIKVVAYEGFLHRVMREVLPGEICHYGSIVGDETANRRHNSTLPAVPNFNHAF